MDEKEVLGNLDRIRSADPTGGLKIADCRHGFTGAGMIVILPNGNGYQVNFADLKCDGCGKTSCHSMLGPVQGCARCLRPTAALETRNYIIGAIPPVDVHLYRFGAFAEAAAKLPGAA